MIKESKKLGLAAEDAATEGLFVLMRQLHHEVVFSH
jgi:hypothetical protein